MFHTGAIKGSGYRPVRAGRRSQPASSAQTKTPFSGHRSWRLGPGSTHSPADGSFIHVLAGDCFV